MFGLNLRGQAFLAQAAFFHIQTLFLPHVVFFDPGTTSLSSQGLVAEIHMVFFLVDQRFHKAQCLPGTSAFEKARRVTYSREKLQAFSFLLPAETSFHGPGALRQASLEVSLTPALPLILDGLYSPLVWAISPDRARLSAKNMAFPIQSRGTQSSNLFLEALDSKTLCHSGLLG